MPDGSLDSKPLQTRIKLVRRYFNLISKKDVRGLLELFSEKDPVVYEPFSKEDGLHGKDSIESFLKVAIMANEGMKRTIRILEKTAENGDETLTAFVTFERGDTLQGRFTFSFATEPRSASSSRKGDHIKKIKSLRIRFM